jgi:hypothetical protein
MSATAPCCAKPRRVSIPYDRALGPSGLRITQYAILAELGRTNPMTITELANAMVWIAMGEVTTYVR